MMDVSYNLWMKKIYRLLSEWKTVPTHSFLTIVNFLCKCIMKGPTPSFSINKGILSRVECILLSCAHVAYVI